MNTLPAKTYADIMELDPCFNPADRGLCTRDWAGTALDVLEDERVSDKDALWLVCRDGWLPDRLLRLFAVRCGRKALALIETPGQCSVDACDVAERYANGEASDSELFAAYTAARAATRLATHAAIHTAAMPARYAARSAACAAACATAHAAVDAADTSTDAVAVYDAAYAAARAEQRQHLLQMVREWCAGEEMVP